MRNELSWFIAFLILFIIVLILAGSPSFYELGLIIVAFSINWGIISMIIKQVKSRNISTESQMKELSWFGGILVLFLSLMVIIGSPTYGELIIATSAFTFISIVRSLIFKKFAPTNNVSTA